MSATAELIESAHALAGILEAGAGTYTYEEITVKRWILGPGGRAGNCEECVENADAGEIEESEFFPAASQYGYVDEPPLHAHCECTVEYRDTRRRVYVAALSITADAAELSQTIEDEAARKKKKRIS